MRLRSAVGVFLTVWILWAREDLPSRRTLWSQEGIEQTADGCWQLLRRLAEVLQRNVIENAKGTESLTYRLTTGVMVIDKQQFVTRLTYECWPETVDPRR